MEPFDTDSFIAEIQAEPAIWDYESDCYSNRTDKGESSREDMWNAEKRDNTCSYVRDSPTAAAEYPPVAQTPCTTSDCLFNFNCGSSPEKSSGADEYRHSIQILNISSPNSPNTYSEQGYEVGVKLIY
ncbi:hypothetical protein JTB14_003392 [Gonioctena quinquepunctata]|nr:hypothetical protein JTB14_003392 [Gonioctena quinquepunctata]